VREALNLRAAAGAAAKAALLERARHELGCREVPARARPAVRRLGRDPFGELARLVAVEQHVRGQSLRQRTRPALEREHRKHDRQKGRNEGCAVYPRLNHGGSTYNSEG
jgi:hypothetical protein